MAPVRRQWLDNAYREHVDKWLWKEWGYARGWNVRFPEMVLWYAVAGWAVGGDTMADTFVRQVRAGLPIHPRRRPTWRDAKALTTEMCEVRGSNPVDWLTGGCGTPEEAWYRLHEVHGIKSKIASFLMRDLSFLRDYSSGEGGAQVVYRRNIARGWYDRLPCEDQALFVPIDVYVLRCARRYGASRLARQWGRADIQADPDLHRRVATEIVRWARAHRCDPRDLDMYWFNLLAGNINEDGTPAS
jgi:hypothetical protein